MTSKRKTTEQFIESAVKIHGDKYDYNLSNYINNKTKLKIKCNTCYTIFEKTPVNHLINKQGCPTCSNNKISNQNKLSLTTVISNFKKLHGDLFDYSDVIYVDSHTKINIKCNTCNNTFEQTPSNHVKLKVCPVCLKSNQIRNLDDFIISSKNIFGDTYDYSNFVYVNAFTKGILKCNKHNTSVEVTPNNHIHSKFGGCVECLKFDKSISFEEFVEDCNRIHGEDTYDYSLAEKDYDGITRTKIKILCNKHEEFFFQSIFDHRNGEHGCQKCNNKKSRLEEFIKKYLEDNDIIFEERKRGILEDNKELDFYFKDKGIAFEINGLRYHTQFLGGKGMSYHLNKTKECEKLGIQLYHINEDEIVHDEKIVVSKLNSIFKKNKISIYGRKCGVRLIDNKIKKSFLDKYHLLKNDSSSIKLGLFYNNRITSIMTFKKENQNNEWVLNRYCCNFHFNVIGGAGKLLKYFERNYKPHKITTFADKRWSNGDMYYKLGFNLTETNPPNYRVTTGRYPYVTIDKRQFRHKYIKNRFENYDKNLTEWENLKNNGYDIIWDCGKLKFEKYLDNPKNI
jgi:hypothetical protein